MEVAMTGFTGFTGSTGSEDHAKTTTASSNGTQPTSPTTEDRDSPPAVTTDPTSSKNKEIGEEFVTTPTAHSERMSDMPEGDEGWRAYYEHPLTAATTAMLNINGTNEEQNSTGVGLLYEYYKLPPIEKAAEKALADKYAAALPEIWTAAVTSSGAALLTSPRSGSSAKPVSSPTTADHDSEAEPTTAVLTPSEVAIYLSRAQVKPDPDGLLGNASANSPVNNSSLSSPESNPDHPLTNGEVALSPGPSPSIKQEPNVSPLTTHSPSPPITVQLDSSPSSQNELQVSPVDLVAVTAPLPPSAVAVSTSPVAGSPDSAKSRDMQNSQQGSTVIALGAAATQPFSTQVFASQATYETLGMAQYGVLTNAVAPPQYGTQTSNGGRTLASNVYTFAAATAGDYYRDYYSPSSTPSAADQYQTVRQHLTSYADGGTDGSAAFVDRYIRQNGNYKTNLHGLTVDLPSPDSGIGEATITPRDSAGLSQIFDYSELSQTQTILQTTTSADPSPSPSVSSRPASQSSRRSWHEFGRNSESDKVQIPKLHSDVGFKYYLESPISTSQRREDDRITYINKGQFYGITLEYLPDPDKPLKSPTVKTIVMLVFREEKSHEDEIKAWSFWHSRQHSVKQRILDADTKNSSGIIGQIDEITHNAIAFYWNPMESPAKINVAVQCLSTDFSNQKGVKGLPLHIQVDTFDDYREGSTPVHRGYCQIKVFCDKGAERKTRDEERRAAKRKLTATGSKCGQPSALSSNPQQQPSFLPAPPGGRKKMEEMYHPPMDRSEFYSMSDLLKPAVLFTPSDELDKKEISTISQQMAGMELTFYAHANVAEDTTVLDRRDKDSANEPELTFTHPPSKRIKIYPSDRELENDRLDLVPTWTRSDDRYGTHEVLLYARRETEDVYHALHLVPPSLAGLANAIENKYKIGHNSIRSIYKRCSKGITVQMDDDIIKHYCNEDTFIIEIIKTEDELFDVTLVEL